MSPNHTTTTKRRVSIPSKIRPGARREEQPGAQLTCLVLASGAGEWVAVDLSSGALVRNSLGSDNEHSALSSTAKLDVVRFALAKKREPFDPARPEAVVVDDEPQALRKLQRRKIRRLLRRLAAPENLNTPILCLHGPSIAYVDLDGSAPSIVVARIHAKALEITTRSEDLVICAMSWAGTTQVLPVIDPGVCEAAWLSAPQPLKGPALIKAIRYEPGFVVVGLAAPIKGHAKKVILSVLPR